MALISFDSLPDTARLFSFNSDRALSADEIPALRTEMEGFLGEWTAHRRELEVGYDIRYNRFLLIGVDESLRSPSGCSVDALVAALKSIGSRFGVELVDSPDITYRDGEKVEAVTRSEFERLVESGKVSGTTIVFDRMAPSMGDLRHGTWERPARDSWHGRAFNFQESLTKAS